MHPSALKTGQLFFDTYTGDLASGMAVDIGGQDVNGSLRTSCPAQIKYVAVDFVRGNGVDVVLTDPYVLPFHDETVDIVVSSSCFEHSEMFWLLFLEILRILKPTGLFYLNAPSNGIFHRYPVDCWRFYPDSGAALVNWAKRNKYDPMLLESFIGNQDADVWNDFVAVFLKDKKHSASYPARILEIKTDFTNGVVAEQKAFLNPQALPEDLEKLKLLQR